MNTDTHPYSTHPYIHHTYKQKTRESLGNKMNKRLSLLQILLICLLVLLIPILLTLKCILGFKKISNRIVFYSLDDLSGKIICLGLSLLVLLTFSHQPTEGKNLPVKSLYLQCTCDTRHHLMALPSVGFSFSSLLWVFFQYLYQTLSQSLLGMVLLYLCHAPHSVHPQIGTNHRASKQLG